MYEYICIQSHFKRYFDMFRINVIAALDTAVKVTTDDVMPCML